MNLLLRLCIVTYGVGLFLLLLPSTVLLLCVDGLWLFAIYMIAWLMDKSGISVAIENILRFSLYQYLAETARIYCFLWVPELLVASIIHCCNQTFRSTFPTFLHQCVSTHEYDEVLFPIRFLIALYPTALVTKSSEGLVPLHMYCRNLVYGYNPEDFYTPATKTILVLLIQESPEALLNTIDDGQYVEDEFPSMFSEYIKRQRVELLQRVLPILLAPRYFLPEPIISNIASYHGNNHLLLSKSQAIPTE